MLYAQWAPTIYKRAFLKREEQRGWLLLTPRNQAELMFEYVQVHLTMRWECVNLGTQNITDRIIVHN
jgi:hypothetical protein